MEIFVSVVYFGLYDDRASEIVYVGFNYDKAISSIRNYNFPDVRDNDAYIEHWKNDKKIYTQDVLL